MKNRDKHSLGKKTLIFLVSLILIWSAYLLISGLGKQDEPRQEVDTALTVARIAAENVTALHWVYQGEDVALRNHDGQWEAENDANFPLDQNYPRAMLEAISVIQAREALDSDALAEYGLDAPVLSIEILQANGSTDTLDLSPAGEGSGSCYLRYNDSNKVYLTDDALFTAFSQGLYDMVIRPEPPVYTELKSMRVNAGQQQLNLVRSNTGATRTYSGQFHWFIQNQDGTFSAVDNELAETLISSVLDNSRLRCVDYQAAGAELDAYGLNAPAISIVIAYAGEPLPETEAESDDNGNGNELFQYVLDLGSVAEDAYYARIDGLDMVFALPVEFVQSLLDTTADSLKIDDVLLMDWDTVTKMDVAMYGAGHTLVFNRAEDGTAYTLDGQAADSAKVEAFLAALDALTSVGRATGTTTSGQEIGIVFYRDTDIFSQMSFSLTPYDDASSVLVFNGQSDLLVDKQGIEKAKQAFSALLP